MRAGVKILSPSQVMVSQVCWKSVLGSDRRKSRKEGYVRVRLELGWVR